MSRSVNCLDFVCNDIGVNISIDPQNIHLMRTINQERGVISLKKVYSVVTRITTVRGYFFFFNKIRV